MSLPQTAMARTVSGVLRDSNSSVALGQLSAVALRHIDASTQPADGRHLA
jgi:hypothetical protein